MSEEGGVRVGLLREVEEAILKTRRNEMKIATIWEESKRSQVYPLLSLNRKYI